MGKFNKSELLRCIYGILPSKTIFSGNVSIDFLQIKDTREIFELHNFITLFQQEALLIFGQNLCRTSKRT